MTKELQDKLFNKYPKIFRQKDLSKQETCMCWGIECGDGLYWLIDQLCSNLQFNTDKNNSGANEGNYPQIEATQVKEKFGGLCFYVQSATDKQYAMISFAQNLSYDICHKCGTTKHVGHTQGWIYTECKDCIQQNERAKDLTWKENETD